MVQDLLTTVLLYWAEIIYTNAVKTKVVLITRARLKDTEYPNRLIMGNNRIKFGNSVKYLGVMLDAKLSWAVNLDQKIKKAKRTM